MASFAGRGGAGNPFLGVYKAGRFIDQADERWGETQAKATAKRLFPLDRVLPALTQDGNHTEVRIEREGSWTWDIGGSFFEQMRMRDFISGWGLVLFWTSPVTLESLSPEPSTLDAEALGTLRGEAERLFADALAERPPDERDETLTLGDAIVHRVAGTGVVAVLFPTDMKCSECITSDGRGSIFFLYAPADRRIVFQTFGHPEWNPAGKSVRVVMPRLYFRICGDPEVYFLADYHGPWEEIRYAIFQMRSGLRMLVSWGG